MILDRTRGERFFRGSALEREKGGEETQINESTPAPAPRLHPHGQGKGG